MPIKIIVNGAEGRMGQETVKAVNQAPNLELVATAEKNSDLAMLIKQHQANVVIDFTIPHVVYENTQCILHAGARPVIGTTGMSSEQISTLTHLCQQLKRGAIIAPNFSISAVLMMKYAREMARYFSEVEIIEFHHNGKLDSPSGTALKTAEMIAETLQVKKHPLENRETIPHARGATHHGIPIHAVRLPGMVAHEEIIFGGKSETLHLRHNSIHRDAFMPGVLLACEKVMDLDHLIYGLEHVL